MFMQRLLTFLSETQLDTTTINTTERLQSHRLMLQKKPMMRAVFTEFHHAMMALDEKFFGNVEGLRVELGAGVCPMRETYAQVLATDVVPDRHLDRVLDATAMDLDSSSVRALYGQNCFHHFPRVELFLQEVTRVVAPGGGVILIEPYYGPLAQILFKRMFATEGFDKQAVSWDNSTQGPMSGANQALSYIVFVRDQQILRQRFPQLQVLYAAPLHNYLRYVLSGGLNFKQMLPDALVGVVKLCEQLLRPVSAYLALHYVLVVQRRP